MATDPPPIQQPALETQTVSTGGIFTRPWILWFNYIKDNIEAATSFLGLTDTPSSYTGQGLKVARVNAAETAIEFSSVGSGDVLGGSSSTDNAIARFDGTSGKIIQNSGVTIDDNGVIKTSGIKRENTEKVSGYTVLVTDDIVIFDITSNTVCTLPSAASVTDSCFSVVNKYTSTANLTFSQNINGSSTFTLTPQQNVTILSDGTEYLIYE